MITRKLVTISLILFFNAALAQEVPSDLSNTNDDLEESQLRDSIGPKVIHAPPARFAQISYVVNGPFNITSEGVATDNNFSDKSTVNRYEEIYAKLKLPVLLKEKTTIIAGFQYRYHEYNFKNEDIENTWFTDFMDNKHLNRIRGDLYLTHNFEDDSYLLMKGGVQFSGDYKSDVLPRSKFMRQSLTGVYGKRKNENLSYGFGISMSHQARRFSIYPVFTFTYWKNEHLGIQSAFPANLKLILSGEKERFMSFGYSLSTTRYILDTREVLPVYDFTVLRRLDVQYFAEFQTQLFAFVWLGATAGLNTNINMRIADGFLRTDNDIIESKVSPSPYAEISIFLTIPESLRDKADSQSSDDDQSDEE